jgi:hypothetical protein
MKAAADMYWKQSFRAVLASAIILCTLAPAAEAQYAWQPGFEWPGGKGLNNTVFALVAFDDGGGPAICGVVSNNMARWAARWHHHRFFDDDARLELLTCCERDPSHLTDSQHRMGVSKVESELSKRAKSMLILATEQRDSSSRRPTSFNHSETSTVADSN